LLSGRVVDLDIFGLEEEKAGGDGLVVAQAHRHRAAPRLQPRPRLKGECHEILWIFDKFMPIRKMLTYNGASEYRNWNTITKDNKWLEKKLQKHRELVAPP
jgi:hypothetical protein